MEARDPERPQFTSSEAQMLTSNLFDLQGSITNIEELPSERDQNFHIISKSEQEFILKISTSSEKIETLEMQNAAIKHLSTRLDGYASPTVYKSRNGHEIEKVSSPKNEEHYVRLLSFLPGKNLSKVNPQTPEMLKDFGRFVGSISRGFEGFDHQAAHRLFYWDLKRASSVIQEYSTYIKDESKLELVKYYLDLFETLVVPLMYNLRSSVIHNDVNDNNIVVSHPHESERRTFGLLDFGDMVYSCTINELAITIAYALLDKPGSLISISQEITAGYHAVFPITELEIDLLFPLICTRLATSVSISAYQKTLEPDSEYIVISESPAWDVLTSLVNIHPRYFSYCIREAIGLEPCPRSAEIREWIRSHSGEFASPVGIKLDGSNSVVIDLSVGSTDMLSSTQLTDINAFSKLVSEKLPTAGTGVGIGRYNEPRLIYDSEQYLSEGDELRTVHIGVDLLVNAGSPVYAVTNGRIHSFHDNDKPFDNGPTIIVEHATTSDGPPFYLLYGHLSRDSLDKIKIGQEVKKGEQIGVIGKYPENGGWPPHLHFQLIADMMDISGDFFGVAPPSKRKVWLSICPNPNLILGIPDSLFPPSSLTKERILELRKQHIGPSLGISYRSPLNIVHGFMQYLYDAEGRRYLDVRNNVPQVGHSNPIVVNALTKQASVLNTNTRYLHENLVRYAQRLTSKMPGDLKVCFFVNSGSEANELALRLARTHTRQKDIIAIDGAYHGNTQNLIDISSYKHDGPGGEGPPSHVHIVKMPDTFRGEYRDDPEAGKKYAQSIMIALEDIQDQNRGVCAFICEPLMGCGGQIIFPQGYLKEAFRLVKVSGGVCIADEVQTGFGRMGTHFWGFETQGVVPDIVTLGKPIGNGHPIGAVITTPEIADSFNTGMEFFSTTGGNTVSCAVGMAVLDVIENENLQQNALEVGAYLKSRLESLKTHHEIIGDVRGIGLYIGVELVRNRKSLEPAEKEARYIIERLRELHILVSLDGPLNNVLKIKPPLVFTKENADTLITALDIILREDPILDGLEI